MYNDPTNAFLTEFKQGKLFVPLPSGNCRSAIVQIRCEVMHIGTYILYYLDKKQKNQKVDENQMVKAKSALDALRRKLQLIEQTMQRERRGPM